MNDLIVIHPQQTSFALEAMRSYFIRQRNLDGADTPLGHRWSNLVEQTWNLFFATDPEQREHLKCAIARSTLEARNLRRGQRDRLQISRPALLLTFQTIH